MHIDREAERTHADAVYNALLDVADSRQHWEKDYYIQLATGFDRLPPPSKRKWLEWVVKRAEAGDQRYIPIFQQLVKNRLLT